MRTSPRGYVPFETSHLTLYGKPSTATPTQDRFGRCRRHRVVRGLGARGFTVAGLTALLARCQPRRATLIVFV
jgi:hypothetical protein